MERIAFWQLPLWVRLAAALTLFNTWVVIAEYVIDGYGLDAYLPFYRYGDVCIWDIAVIIGLGVLFVMNSRPPRAVQRRRTDAGAGECLRPHEGVRRLLNPAATEGLGRKVSARGPSERSLNGSNRPCDRRLIAPEGWVVPCLWRRP